MSVRNLHVCLMHTMPDTNTHLHPLSAFCTVARSFLARLLAKPFPSLTRSLPLFLSSFSLYVILFDDDFDLKILTFAFVAFLCLASEKKVKAVLLRPNDLSGRVSSPLSRDLRVVSLILLFLSSFFFPLLLSFTSINVPDFLAAQLSPERNDGPKWG